MITVGLVNELRFLSFVQKAPIEVSLKTPSSKLPIQVQIDSQQIIIHYNEQLIWLESVEEGISMFGVESCQNIAQIIFLMDKNNPGWKELVYKESS